MRLLQVGWRCPRLVVKGQYPPKPDHPNTQASCEIADSVDTRLNMKVGVSLVMDDVGVDQALSYFPKASTYYPPSIVLHLLSSSNTIILRCFDAKHWHCFHSGHGPPGKSTRHARSPEWRRCSSFPTMPIMRSCSITRQKRAIKTLISSTD